MNLPQAVNGWRPEPPAPSTPLKEAIGSVLYEFRWIIADTAMLTWRMLMHYRRNPEMLLSTIFGPLMFLFLFTYVFGGAIGRSTEINYIDYLLPGVLIQNNIFTVLQTGIGLADDMQKGFVDRYRSLPMARSAVIGGRVVATTTIAFFSAIWTIGIAVVIGMRFHGGFWPGLSLPFVVALFCFGFAWISALVGVSVRDTQTASSLTFFVAIPLTFLSSTFVPVETMPGWLQVFAEVNPITQVVNLSRNLAQGGPIATYALPTILWTVLFVFGIGSLATWRYKRIS